VSSDRTAAATAAATIEDCNKKNKAGPGSKGLPALATRAQKKKKLKLSKKTSRSPPAILVKEGMTLVTETLSTCSEVDVLWQDGTEEVAIPSTELYPIQHLDDHEFFPGDFVTEAKEGFHPHSYGVIQEVNHAERTCRVRWLRTYTESNQPRPQFVETTEMSAYDLKDHPDFRFRPGAIVIRVANWAAEMSGLGAGQVMDINTQGEVGMCDT
jgi:ubiquitin-conjugating enzyme E2 O